MENNIMRILFLAISILYLPIVSFADQPPSNQKINFKYIQSLAEDLAKKPYKSSLIKIPEVITSKSFGQRQQVQYKNEDGLWKKDDLNFYLAFMPIAGHFNVDVNLYEVTDGSAKKISFNADNFNYGNSGITPNEMPKGYSGFRIVSPNGDKDIIVFQGASYFRPIPPDSYYGLSLRALSVNTVMTDAKEEFPDFTDFWIVKPESDSSELTFYALLNGKSVTGAYKFVLNYDKVMTIKVESTIILRNEIDQLGFAPMTTQYWYGQDTHFKFGQSRPEVHNSDGLIMHGDNVYYWQPLVNYINKPAVNSYNHFNKLDYFGFLQRDRNFNNYVDLHNQYYLDPNVWIKPEGNQNGNVRMVILPTKIQYTDNVNSFWIPDNKPQVGKPYDFNYTINASIETPQENVAYVNNSWNGTYYKKNKTYFVVSYTGDELMKLAEKSNITANINIIGPAKVIGTPAVILCKKNSSWLSTFYVQPDNNTALSQPINIRCYLSLNSKTISETWNYFWYPVLTQSITYQ
ncbi:MAG: glucan biosynthesis protein [bacterium]|nr:glucan biosynthesis protein [bacterium]